MNKVSIYKNQIRRGVTTEPLCQPKSRTFNTQALRNRIVVKNEIEKKVGEIETLLKPWIGSTPTKVLTGNASDA